jgi:predicted CoA-binding protein
MPDIKEILDKNKIIAMIGVSKDPKKTLNNCYEIYAGIWF